MLFRPFRVASRARRVRRLLGSDRCGHGDRSVLLITCIFPKEDLYSIIYTPYFLYPNEIITLTCVQDLNGFGCVTVFLMLVETSPLQTYIVQGETGGTAGCSYCTAGWYGMDRWMDTPRSFFVILFFVRSKYTNRRWKQSAFVRTTGSKERL